MTILREKVGNAMKKRGENVGIRSREREDRVVKKGRYRKGIRERQRDRRKTKKRRQEDKAPIIQYNFEI